VTAPDFIEPIVGFRAWRVDRGVLVPWSAGAAGAWNPGVNTARCLFHVEHRAPVATCTCGLYALADADDERLRPHVEAVGAIVAWGDVEVHRTGFRAEQATIVALALPDPCPRRHAEDLRDAARRYGVPLVAQDHLVATACEYGRPIPWASVPVRPRAAERPAVPSLETVGLSGMAVDDHVAALITAHGVRLRPTREARDAAGGDGERVHLLEAGDPVRRGDVVMRFGDERGIVVRSPLSGHVAYCAGMDVVVAPTRWEDEAFELVWGAAGEQAYRAELGAAARHGDPFAVIRIAWVHATASIRSAGDVLAALRRERDRPRFADEGEVYAQLGRALAERLATPDARRAAGRLRLTILLRLHRPDAALLLDLAGEHPEVRFDTAEEPADLTLYAAAETADDLFAGRTDFATAVRARDVQSSASAAEVLRAASVLKPLVAASALR
jgi:hypothetical protein